MEQTDHLMALNKAENTLLQQRLNCSLFKDPSISQKLFIRLFLAFQLSYKAKPFSYFFR